MLTARWWRISCIELVSHPDISCQNPTMTMMVRYLRVQNSEGPRYKKTRIFYSYEQKRQQTVQPKNAEFARPL